MSYEVVRGMEELHAFLTSPPDGHQLAALRSGRLTNEESPGVPTGYESGCVTEKVPFILKGITM